MPVFPYSLEYFSKGLILPSNYSSSTPALNQRTCSKCCILSPHQGQMDKYFPLIHPESARNRHNRYGLLFDGL
jgi:hypothetical protein